MSDLARKLAEHPRWQWRSGMIALDARGSLGRWPVNARYDRPGKWADLDDPATQGCLLAMLREVAGRVEVDAGRVEDDAAVSVLLGSRQHWSTIEAATLGEALAEALVRAWEVSDE